jgi:tripartite-type tricarboxylate transporter receptor subunit TctC
MLNRRHFIATVALAPLVRSAVAADWPQRPVRIVYPYAPGGSGDAMARILAAQLNEVFGRPFVVENKPGANGTLAAETVARSPADGYTLLFALTPQIAIAPAMMKVPYDPVRDFTPIGTIATSKFALIVNPKLPVQTLAEFLNYVRAQPQGFAYAEGGVGSISHLSMVLLLDRAGLTGTNVSYKSSELAILDVLAGQLPAAFVLLGDALSHSGSGGVRLIAVSGTLRSDQAPNVPTVAESGFPGYSAISWWGLMAPSGTPESIVERLASEVSRVARDQKVSEQMRTFGVDPLRTTPAEFAAMVSSDIALWRRAVKLAGLEPQ